MAVVIGIDLVVVAVQSVVVSLFVRSPLEVDARVLDAPGDTFGGPCPEETPLEVDSG